jgi:hypothetical protein
MSVLPLLPMQHAPDSGCHINAAACYATYFFREVDNALAHIRTRQGVLKVLWEMSDNL